MKEKPQPSRILKSAMAGASLSSSPGQQRFHLTSFLVQHTAARVVFQQVIPVAQGLKQMRFQGFAQRCIPYVRIGVRGERAGFRTAVGIDVEKAPARRDAAA